MSEQRLDLYILVSLRHMESSMSLITTSICEMNTIIIDNGGEKCLY